MILSPEAADSVGPYFLAWLIDSLSVCTGGSLFLVICKALLITFR